MTGTAPHIPSVNGQTSGSSVVPGYPLSVTKDSGQPSQPEYLAGITQGLRAARVTS